MKKKNSSRPHIEHSPLRTDPVRQIIQAKAVLAPMSGITDIPFRLMARKYGCDFAFTEMIDVNGIKIGDKTQLTIMAGPCAVESEELMEEVASKLSVH